MLVIRLSRGGAKKRPFYHIVAAEKRSSRDGRFVERLGYYNPIAGENEEGLRMNITRIDHWIANGAIPSNRVKGLLKDYKKIKPKDEAKGSTE